MLFTLRIKRDVANHAGFRGGNKIDGSKVGLFLCQQCRHLGKDARRVGQL